MGKKYGKMWWGRVLAYPVSSKTLIKNGERESDKEKILQSMMVPSEKNVLFYPFAIF